MVSEGVGGSVGGEVASSGGAPMLCLVSSFSMVVALLALMGRGGFFVV